MSFLVHILYYWYIYRYPGSIYVFEMYKQFYILSFFIPLISSTPVLPPRDSKAVDVSIVYNDTQALTEVTIGSETEKAFPLNFSVKDTWISKKYSGEENSDGNFITPDGQKGSNLSKSLTIGGIEVKNVEMGYIQNHSAIGQIGFGLGSSLLRSLKDQGKISKEYFSLYYAQASVLRQVITRESKGHIVLGGTDESKYDKNKLQELSIIEDGKERYCVKLKGVSIRVNNTDFPYLKSPKALCFDPSSKALKLPFKNTHTNVLNASSFAITCPGCPYESERALFKFDLGGEHKISINTTDYCAPSFVPRGCFSMIEESPDDNLYFGKQELTRLYTIFNQEDLKLSWAPFENAG